MPRQSSRGRPGPRPAARAPMRNPPKPGRPGPRPAARAPLRNTPKPAAPAPRPTPVESGPVSGGRGFGSVVAEGMAFGVGNAIAHWLLHPRVVKHETVASLPPSAKDATMNSHGGPDACVGQLKAFQDCLNNSASEISKCQSYMDMLSECNRNAGPTPGMSA